MVGTYTGSEAGGSGIYSLHLDTLDGELSDVSLAARTANPSFLAAHPTGPFVYAVNEAPGEALGSALPHGTVTAFTRGATEVTLRRLGIGSSGGVAPCHLSVDPSGRWLLVANYGGSVALLPIMENGDLGRLSWSVEHSGSGADPTRQAGPHPHAFAIAPNSTLALAPDLGADGVVAYHFRATEGPPFGPAGDAVALATGSGPRHVAFHPSGEAAYVTCELDSTLAVLQLGPGDRMTSVGAHPTAPLEPETRNYPAEVAVHPTGKYVYVSNRGHDSIAVFKVLGHPTELQRKALVRTGGAFPRHFALDASGGWLVVANQGSGELTSFRIGPDGVPQGPLGRRAVPAPACVLIGD